MDGLVAYCEGGTINNCINNINITGNTNVGGIVGVNNRGKINNCINKGKLSGEVLVGGIAGNLVSKQENGEIDTNAKTEINNCMSDAEIEGKYLVGGIVGENSNNTTIINCCNLNAIKSTDGTDEGVASSSLIKGSYTGGITGRNSGRITCCINNGVVTAKYRVVGGIAGRNLGSIWYCCNKKNVTAEAVVGGIVGNNRGNISMVYNIAENIEATNKVVVGNVRPPVGGITGTQSSTSDALIQCAYNTSKISGVDSDSGGIIGGMSSGKLSSVYNMGMINSYTTIGPIYGWIVNGVTIENSDITTEENMKSWNQDTINNNIGGEFYKKQNSLPILNITVRGMQF